MLTGSFNADLFRTVEQDGPPNFGGLAGSLQKFRFSANATVLSIPSIALKLRRKKRNKTARQIFGGALRCWKELLQRHDFFCHQQRQP